MSAEAAVTSLVRAGLTDIFLGSFFLFLGLIAICVAVVRRRSEVQVLFWIGVWSALYGASMLARSPAVIAAIPDWLEPARQLLIVCGLYLTLVVGMMSFLQLTLGFFRRVLKVLLVCDVVVGIAGIGWFLLTRSPDRLLFYNEVLAAVGLALLVALLVVPRLSRKYLALAQHRVLIVGTLVFASLGLIVNVVRPFKIAVPGIINSGGFAVFLLSFAYVAIDRMVNNEYRLLSIEKELEIARQLQFSILSERAPEIASLRIAFAYEPMTAVAGDFYEFLPLDKHRVGFLVADVSGHGVPAALIASMIKVATQSVDGCAQDPGELLKRLGNILTSHLRGQFVSAAYLWIDTEHQIARYSSAGHPPLLLWRAKSSTVTRIESNGLLFGVMPNCDYPVRDLSIGPGDRFLMYTDGVTEPENAVGEAFGDRKLEQIIYQERSLAAPQLSSRVLLELRAWQPASLPQQDDITLLVIDIL